MTETAPSGGEYPQTKNDATREADELAGLIESAVAANGWTSEVVQSGDGTVVLGLTAPSGRDFSLALNPTP
jgi:hypothetical protein